MLGKNTRVEATAKLGQFCGLKEGGGGGGGGGGCGGGGGVCEVGA